MTKFLTWIIFTILFALAENLRTTTSPNSHNYDVTEEVTNAIADVFVFFDWKNLYHQYQNSSKNDSMSITRSDGIKLPSGLKSYNFTMKFEFSPNFKGRVSYRENLTMTCEMVSIVVKANLLDTDHYIATKEIPLNFTLSTPKPIENSKPEDKTLISVDYHGLDNYTIDLYSNCYDFKKNESDEIRQSFKSYIKQVIYEKFNGDWNSCALLIMTGFFRAMSGNVLITAKHEDFIHHEQKHYCFIKTIASENFTLRNATIKRLWNFQSISMDFSNPEAFLVLASSDVHGTVTQIFTSGSEAERIVPLMFKANTVYFLKDQKNNRTHVKAEEYSVINLVSKNSLSEDQSRLVMEAIESAIATRIPKLGKSRP